MTTDIDRFTPLNPFIHEHERLQRAVGDSQWLQKKRRSPERSATTFAELADHLQAHFVHEEQNEGFFESVIDPALRLKPRADALIEKHAVMSATLVQLQLLAANDLIAGGDSC